MSMQAQQLEQISVTIEQARHGVSLRDALERLKTNKDYQLIIETGYFEVEASRVVLVKADPEMASEEKQKDCSNIITSIGGLYKYLHKITALGNMFEQSLEADLETQGDIRQEQVGEREI